MIEGDAVLGETQRKLNARLRSTLSRLRGLELATPLQMEIVAKLLDGKRNLPELVELIYNERSGDEGYKSDYMRVRRAAVSLQARGLISTRLFGKNKPYKLTRYAVEMLTPIADEPVRYRLVPRTDILVYVAGISFPIATLLLSRREILEPSRVLVLGWLSCVLLGVAFCRFVEAIRKVI